MAFLVRALRFALSKRGVATIAAIRRARALGREWYPVRVTGISMIPTLRPGDLLAVRFPSRGEPRTGQIVVAARDDLEMVKRVAAMPGDTVEGRILGSDEYWLRGDNPQRSTDSRVTGPVRRADIMGIVRSCYWPPGRARLFR